MYSLLVAIAMLVGILLIIIILLQSSKGSGLAGTFGGAGNMGSMFGSRRTADFLSKFTWWLGGILLGLSILINLFFLPGRTTTTDTESIIQGQPQQQQQQQSVPDQPVIPQVPQSTDQGEGSTGQN
jgi:preprotein translocase subunit SecG